MFKRFFRRVDEVDQDRMEMLELRRRAEMVSEILEPSDLRELAQEALKRVANG